MAYGYKELNMRRPNGKKSGFKVDTANHPLPRFLPCDCTITVGAEATNAITVTVQFKDVDGNSIAEAVHGRCFLSDLSTGIDLLNTAHDGGVAIAAGGGAILLEDVTDKVFSFVTNATGAIALTATESGAKTAYLVVCLPDGRIKVSGAITHAA